MNNPTKPATVVPLKGEKTDGNDDDVGVAVVPELPISIISDILYRLPVDDVARCKSVHKSWHSLCKDPHFTHSHYVTNKSSQQQNNILLWETGDFTFLLNPINIGCLYLIRNINIFNISATDTKIMGTLVASCNGLLCINTHPFHAYGPNLVYNPLTRDGIALPELIFHPDYDRGHGYRCAFGFDPINNKYKVVLAYLRKSYLDGKDKLDFGDGDVDEDESVFDYGDVSGWYIQKMTGAILTLGESSWRTLQLPEDLEASILNREPVFFNGAFHWVIGMRFHEEYCGKNKIRLDGLLPFDIASENFQIVKFSRSVEIPYSHLEQILLENSIAFVHLKNIDPSGTPLVEIWQIQGANPDGSCLYKHWNFNVHIEGCPFGNDLKGFQLLGAFDEGVFLFKASQPRIRGESMHNHLVLFDTKKDEGSVTEISGAPNPSMQVFFHQVSSLLLREAYVLWGAE